MRTFRTVLPYLIGIAVLFCFAYIHLYGKSSYWLSEGKRLEENGDLTAAIEAYEWSIHFYTPLINHTQEAVDRLNQIAHRAEMESATSRRIEALQSVVSGLAVIRHFRQPFADEKKEAREELERLRSRMTGEDPSGAASPKEGNEAEKGGE